MDVEHVELIRAEARDIARTTVVPFATAEKWLQTALSLDVAPDVALDAVRQCAKRGVNFLALINFGKQLQQYGLKRVR